MCRRGRGRQAQLHLRGSNGPRTAYQWRPVLEQYGIFIILIAAFVPIGRGGTLLSELFQILIYPIVNFLVGYPVFG